MRGRRGVLLVVWCAAVAQALVAPWTAAFAARRRGPALASAPAVAAAVTPAAVEYPVLDPLRALAASEGATPEKFAAALRDLPSAVDALRALDLALASEAPAKLLSSSAFASTLDMISRAAVPPAACGALIGHTMARLRKAGIAPNDDDVLVALGSALLKARKNVEARAAVDATSPKRQKSAQVLRTAIVASARLDDAERVRELTEKSLRESRNAKKGPEDSTISEMDDATLKFAIKALAAAGDFRTPFSIVDALPVERRSTPLYHAAITACGKAKPSKGKTAMILWRRMKADGCDIPRATYNALLHAAQSAELSNGTTAILAEMAARNVSLNVVSYNIALSSLARKGRFGEMLDLLDGMENQKIFPTEITFGTAIYGAAQANNSAAAMELLRAQRRLDMAPADAALGAALEACLRDPDGANGAAVAAEIVEMMADLEVTLSRRERIERLAREAVHRGVIDQAKLRRDEEILGMVLRNRQAAV